VAWHFSHNAVVATWLADLPLVVVPLWQSAQSWVPKLLWSKVTGFHAVVAWQRLHSEDVATWPIGLPEIPGRVPSWHDVQAETPVISVWLSGKIAGLKAVVEWQASHLSELGMWPKGLPADNGVLPLWHCWQLPAIISLWSTILAGMNRLGATSWQVAQLSVVFG